MKIKALLFTLVLAVLFCGVLPRQAEARVTFSYFYDSLQPYGEWVDVDTYGYCWQPRGMERDWRPYTDGYWSYTDAGWTWVSYEDFGAITYHYGRWVNLEDYGWVWKPDYEWGPAWVSWRQSDDYIGWAPLPPDAVFEPQTGIGVWVDRDYDIGPSAYAFCEYRYFGAPVMRNVLIPRHRNVTIINNTVNITNITVVTGNNHSRVVFNGGLNYAQVAARSNNRIETLQLVRQTDGDWAQHHRSELSRRVGAQLFINAPEVEAPKTRFAPAVVSQQIHAPKIDSGWAGVSNPAEREQIKARYHEQTQGLTRATAPATSVNVAQVQTMMNEARTHQKQAPQAAAAQLPMQIQQPAPVQKEHLRQKEQPQSQVQQPTATPLPMQIQQPAPVQKERTHQKEQPQSQVQQPAATPLPMQIQQPSPAQKEHLRQKEQPQGQIIPSVDQPKIQQEQAQRAQQAQAQAEQQRRAADAEARAARQQQEQAQRAQQAQAQAEQQRRAADAEARAARQQQEQAQRVQQARAQAEQQRSAAETESRAARQQQEQAQRIQQAQAQAQRAQQEQAAKQNRQAQEQQQATSSDKRKHEGPGPSPTPTPH